MMQVIIAIVWNVKFRIICENFISTLIKDILMVLLGIIEWLLGYFKALYCFESQSMLLMFFSLDRPVTKNQILNTKYLPTFFVVVSIQKEKFWIKTTSKKIGWHLVFFSMWFLVAVRSNEKNIKPSSFYLTFHLIFVLFSIFYLVFVICKIVIST